MRKIWLIIITLIILAFALGFYFNRTITGQTINIAEKYSFTKAVCEDNKCLDVKITCEGDKAVNIELASEIKEFPLNWEDPRTEEEKEKLCE